MTRYALLVLPALLLAACSIDKVADSGEPGGRAHFDGKLIADGAHLATLGNCASCHTAADGKPYAGGRALTTPFGTVYGSNITPDRDTGIGRWSESEFARAMREGLDREGRHLYPAFPYDHFTHLTDEDIRALYAFIMTRDPVAARLPGNQMLVPRAFVGIWNSLYLERGAYRPDPVHDAQWNRGAYLVQALAHCGDCHTPRNALGAERKNQPFAGGESDGWHAPALNADSPSPEPWTADALYTYLRSGIADSHAQTAGPMSVVVHNLGLAPEQDVRAIAVYFASLDTRSRGKLADAAARSAPATREPALERGAVIYAGACGSCHDRGRDVDGGALALSLATGLTIPTPINLIHIIREGIVPAENERELWMPGFAGSLTDEQIADLVMYLRTLTNAPPWTTVAEDVRKIAKGDQ